MNTSHRLKISKVFRELACSSEARQTSSREQLYKSIPILKKRISDNSSPERVLGVLLFRVKYMVKSARVCYHIATQPYSLVKG
jgi:hypothetical protein